MKIVLLIKMLFLSALLQGQNEIKGVVIDADNKLPLSFVNIGIKNKNIGTVCSEQGVFTIAIPDKHLSDTLTFSMVGYTECSIPIKTLMASINKEVLLHSKAIELNQVDVSIDKLKENKYGIKTTAPKIHMVDASLNRNDIFEIAQVINLSPNPSKLTSLNLLIHQASTDSVRFRINFYEYDGTRPTKRLVETNVTEKRQVDAGWLKFDLKKYNLYLSGRIIVSIEIIPDKKINSIHYEVKLGGTSKSFFRSSSLGEWNTPPHHYRIFITALAYNSSGRMEEDSLEEETIPTTRLFSESVGDSFSLFVKLPKDYSKQRGKVYPTVFLLDANMYFDIVKTSTEKISKNKKIIEPIIIGIGYKDFITGDTLRNRDYTYPLALTKDSFPVSGGADNFLAFLENELIPYVTINYRTDTTNRTIMGHSLGGYFTLYALYWHQEKNSTVFKNYISASPSLDYHNQYLCSLFNSTSANSNEKYKRRLFITLGSLENSEDGGLLFKSFVELLEKPGYRNIHVDKKVYPDLEHMGTAVISFEEGLNLIMTQK